MSVRPDESELLIAFARAASKAQEVEALLRDTVIGVEVVNDTRNRSFEAIAKEIDKLPFGGTEAEIPRNSRESDQGRAFFANVEGNKRE